MEQKKTTTSSTEIMSKIMDLAHEANVKRITVNREGRVILDIPLSAGILGALLAPWLAATAVFGAVFTNCIIEIE